MINKHFIFQYTLTKINDMTFFVLTYKIDEDESNIKVEYFFI